MNSKSVIPFFICAVFIYTHLQAQNIHNSRNNFEIVYEADVKYASNSIWLAKMKDTWKATAINLRIIRVQVEKYNGRINWNSTTYPVDAALEKISSAGLNIYLRISFTSLDAASIRNRYDDNDYHIRSDGKRFLNTYDVTKPILNLTSQRSRNDLLNFVDSLVTHLKALPPDIRNKIKLIVPSMSPDDESEFPNNSYDDSSKTFIYNILTGYSNPEISAFMKFLANKYGTIKELNESWGDGANFTAFNSDQISIRNYNWEGLRYKPNAPDYYKYENGRKDFLDFRRQELKRFLDDCSSIIKKRGFNFGVQFGSIYDGINEFRGFIDPTPLFENVDEFITDDILEYYPNFSFSADYSRSFCKYWDWRNHKGMKFCTETNWPGYADYPPQDLIKYWSLQLRTFYEKGASCLFVSHWGTIDSPKNIPEKILRDSSLLKDYKAWQNTLIKYQNAPVQSVKNNYAFHLACEQGFYSNSESGNNNSPKESFIHNEGTIVGHMNGKRILEFTLSRFSKLKGMDGQSISYDNSGDFVTDFMIQQSPNYIPDNYIKFYPTGTSKYAPKSIKVKFSE